MPTINRYDYLPYVTRQPGRFNPHIVGSLLNQPSTTQTNNQGGQQSDDGQTSGQQFHPDQSDQGNQ